MIDLPRSRALVAFDPNGFLLPTQPVTPPDSRVWRFLHRPPVLVAIGLALFLFAIFGSSLAGFALRALGLGQRGLYAVPVVGTAMVAASYVAFVRIVERRRRIEELELPVAPQELAAGLAGGVALVLAIVAAIALAGGGGVTGFAAADALLPALAVAAGGAAVQEIVMRGEVFRLIERLAGSWLALAASAGVLGLIQLASPEATALSVAAAMIQNGALLAAAFMLTRRLWLGIGLHTGWNLAPSLLTLNFWGEDALTGGTLGPLQSWPGIAIAGVAATGLLTLAARRSRVVAPAWTRGRETRRRLAVEFG